MLKLMNKVRQQKGFTLVELMIVIAVIAILAAVLIPRSGLVQDTAREAGVETNARVVQGIVENLLPRYKDTERANYVTALTTKLNAAGIINPITNKDGAEDLAATTAATGKAVSISSTAAVPAASYAGAVYVQIPAADLKGIKITCYDKKGALIPGTTITVN